MQEMSPQRFSFISRYNYSFRLFEVWAIKTLRKNAFFKKYNRTTFEGSYTRHIIRIERLSSSRCAMPVVRQL